MQESILRFESYLKNEKSNASQYTLVSDEIKDVNITQPEFELDDTNLIK